MQGKVPDDLVSVSEFVMQEQMSKDVAADAIQSRLSRSILDNYSKFIDGMKFVQEVDLDILQAQLAVDTILRDLRGVKMGFVANSLHLIRRRRRRDRLESIKGHLIWMKVRRPPCGCAFCALCVRACVHVSVLRACVAITVGVNTGSVRRGCAEPRGR